MALGIIAALTGLAGAGIQLSSAGQARRASASALSSEEERIENLLDEIDLGRQNAALLRDERGVPSELFAELLQQFPELLNSILPQLTDTSIETTDRLAGAGTDQFLRLREQIAPGTSALSADRLSQIQSLNPANLGQEELQAITRQLGPLIPAGTLDPSTGAVRGATTNPVSLYRNLISSNYSQRRTEFLGEARAFVGDQNNAASRQQVSAADFLNANLDRAFDTSAKLAGADIQQQQLDIDAQEAFIKLAAQGLQSTFDPSANNSLIASGTSGAITSLGSAIEALKTRNK